MKIAIVGCGNMGMAFARAFMKQGLVAEADFLFIEKNEERIAALVSDVPLGTIADQIDERLSAYDLVIIAIKPQDFGVVGAELKKLLTSSQVVLSIMAGQTIEKISATLAVDRIVRAMPNTPAMLGKGITAYTATPSVDGGMLTAIDQLIVATGQAVYLEDEGMLDAVTALSGSGPAYFFYLVKSMIDAGKQMGFTEEVATQLVQQTLIGSYHLMETSSQSLDNLIQAVASKGGTTEAALRTFEAKQVAEGVQEGIYAAQKRSVELAKA